MDVRTRICLWIIVLGLLNFAAYTIGYACVGGDAMNGHVRVAADSGARRHFFINRNGTAREVSAAMWTYSAVHSISVWPTMGAVLLAMLTLAKERITSAMRTTILRGRRLLTLLAVLIMLVTMSMTAYFIYHTVAQLSDPKLLPPGGAA